jgi:hypothetical protein
VKKSGRVRIQAASGAPPVIDTEIATFSGPAYTGGVMYPRQFPDGVVVDLAGIEIPSQSLMCCREHDSRLVVGSTTSVENDRRQLTCAGILSGTDETVLQTAKKAKAVGSIAPWQFSIDSDFDVIDLETLPPGQAAVVNGQRITGPMPIVRRSVLRRIDFVTKGGDRKAWASIKAAGGEFTMTFEEWLASLGFTDPTTLSDDQRTKLQALYDEEVAESAEAATDPEVMAEEDTSSISASSGRGEGLRLAGRQRREDADLQASIRRRRQIEASEVNRLAKIREICKRYSEPSFAIQGKNVSLEAHAIENGWDANQTELQAMRESRPTAPAGHVNTLEASAEALVMSQLMAVPGLAIENALPGRLRIEAAGSLPEFMFWDVNSERKQRLLEAASALRGMNSIDFARAAMRLDGIAPLHTRGVLEAAGSSGSLSNIIGTSVKTAVTTSFGVQEDPTDEWCEADEGPNFLPTPAVSMKIPGGELSPLPENGEAKHGYLSDKGETITIRRFAEQMNIDEQTLINDMLGQIMKILGGPLGWGVRASNTKPGLIFSIIKENPNLADGYALFSTQHANLQTGSALALATLGTAIAKLRLQTESAADGKKAYLNLPPTHMLLPPTLEGAAGSALSSVLGGIAGTQVGVENPYARYGIKPVSDSRLELTTSHTISGTDLAGADNDWYLLSAKAPPFLVRHLASTGRVPRTRTEPLKNGKWGINVDVSYDIAGACIRHQSIVKSEG